MIGHCFNPECHEELRYLRQGSVYRWETGADQMFRTEFFWLCPKCSRKFRVVSNPEGLPFLARCGSKGEGNQSASRVRRVLRGVTQDHPARGTPKEQMGGADSGSQNADAQSRTVGTPAAVPATVQEVGMPSQ